MGFTRTFAEADPSDVDWLGGKGSGLARMSRQGLRVPPGYVIGTTACRTYLAERAVPDGLLDEVSSRLADLERESGKTFGGGPVPLLLSVRSGAPVSMPGMMDTVLNLGLGRDAAVALGRVTGDSRFVADVVARFHAMYADIVLGALDPGEGLDTTADPGEDAGEVYDRVWRACEQALADDSGDSVPSDPHEQLAGAIEAVFRSWNTRRARTYREHHGIPHDLGTAVVVQSMVFGNLSDDSGSGVVFTRNPASGEPGLFGEYLAHSQGEDVVAGTRTPDPVTEALAPELLAELRGTCADLESAQGDVLDIEFTVERSTLYFLQVRSAKRTPEAAVRIAADFLDEGTVPPAAALALLGTEQVRQVQRPGFDDDEVARARTEGRLLTSGIGACPGQVTGAIVLDPDRAKERADGGAEVILARRVTSPADLHGMIAANGIVTATGGSTSHAAVVARALGTACVVGAGAIAVDEKARTLTIGDDVLSEGDEVSLDGASGELFRGHIPSSTPAAATGSLGTVLAAAAHASGCQVHTRVTLPADVGTAREAGASGLVTAVDDVLAATGHLAGLAEQLLGDDSGFDQVTELVAKEFATIFAAAGDMEVGVRAIDLVADESREMLQQTAVTTRHPELSVPLGRPELIAAQLRGLASALATTLRECGASPRVHLAVRHVSDPAEAAALREMARDTGVPVGAYLTSPRAAFGARGIVEACDAVWVEVRALQAAVFGIPPRQLLTAEPLDDYLRRRLLGVDPRVTLDESTQDLLGRIAAVPADGTPIGMRLTGRVPQQGATQLYELGFRRFACDLDETRPLVLALGKAALGVG